MIKSIIVAIVIYWSISILVPDTYLTIATSIALTVFGIITLVRYAPAAHDVVIYGKQLHDDGKDGSHLAILGTTFLSIGAVYTGAVNLLHIPSNVGNAVMAAGLWLMYASPDVVRRDMRVPGLAWLLIIMIASVLTGMFLGSQLEIGQ